VQDHFQELEDDVDVCIGLDTLNFLDVHDRLDTIPKREHNGFLNRIITDVTKKPAIDQPKALPAERRRWPKHIREFYTELATLVPQLEVEMAKILRENDKESLSTVNVHTRGGNLVESGHVALISVARDRDDGDAWLLEIEIWASMRNLCYLSGLRLKSGIPILDYCCACTNGWVACRCIFFFPHFFHRKRFCSHCSAALLLLIRMIKDPDRFILVSILLLQCVPSTPN
jgi:hypothetical protein